MGFNNILSYIFYRIALFLVFTKKLLPLSFLLLPSNMYQNRRSTYNGFILLFVALKVILNLFAISHFGFQRDELLHLALGDHLAWGYKEVPPFIALLGSINTSILGGSVFATRIFSTVAAGLIIWFTGLITVELGGRRFAITLACLSLICSPAFLASDYLFQPVVFDQLWWVLAVYLAVKYINTSSIKYLYLIGIVTGGGLLTKYTMGFFALALVIGLLLTKQRRLLLNRHFWFAMLIALVIFLPTMLWEYNHHFPFFTHMGQLRKSQLQYVKSSDFIVQQLLVNGVAVILWVTGFFFLLFAFKLRKYQFLAFAYLAVFLFLLEMNGKSYYLFGAYPMLFAAGAYGFERWIKNAALRTIVTLVFTLPVVRVAPILLPVLPLNTTLAYFDHVNQKYPFLRFISTWGDRKVHRTSQDYADMFGWDEITSKVDSAYKTLTPDQQKHTIILADNYGEAGAIHHYGKQYHLPDVICLNSSFALWSPTSIANADFIIYIDDNNNVTTKVGALAASYKKTGQVDNPLAVEYGTGIYLISHPIPQLNQVYQQVRLQRLNE